MREFIITTDSHSFHGYEYGKKSLPSLVLLHGMTSDAGTFSIFAEYLTDKFHLICMDNPGHGGTTPFKDEEDYRFSSLVKQIDKVIERLTDTPFYLLGHSWGADLALHFAKAFPEKVAGVILIDGGYVFPEYVEGITEEKALKGWEEYIRYSNYDSWDDVVKVYQGYITKKWDREMDSLIRNNFKKIAGKFIIRADLFSLLSTIKAFYREPCSTTYDSINCPVLLIHATIPRIDRSRSEGIQKIKHSIRDIKIIGLENTRHNPHWDSPKDVAEEIIIWIQEERR